MPKGGRRRTVRRGARLTAAADFDGRSESAAVAKKPYQLHQREVAIEHVLRQRESGAERGRVGQFLARRR